MMEYWNNGRMRSGRSVKKTTPAVRPSFHDSIIPLPATRSPDHIQHKELYQ